MAAAIRDSNPITPDRVINSGALNHTIDPSIRPAYDFDEPDITRVKIVILAVFEAYMFILYLTIHIYDVDCVKIIYTNSYHILTMMTKNTSIFKILTENTWAVFRIKTF
ncbi:hypothetical protein F4861DRAFT_544558 [Xylaria intraflava]|nr:hypothetical protein F4861DRAFT_544558 [Xylaria intraflava]